MLIRDQNIVKKIQTKNEAKSQWESEREIGSKMGYKNEREMLQMKKKFEIKISENWDKKSKKDE